MLIGEKMKRITSFISCVIVGCIIALFSYPTFAGVKGSKHDFSTNGSGMSQGKFIKNDALAVDEVCVFCHTPHNASQNLLYSGSSSSSTYLWNRALPLSVDPDLGYAGGYQLYSSPSMSITQSDPTGVSLMCLSCHDGVSSIGVSFNSDFGMDPYIPYGIDGYDPLLRMSSEGNSTPKLDFGEVATESDRIGDYYYPGDPLLGGGWGANIGNIGVGRGWAAVREAYADIQTVDLSNDHPFSFEMVDGTPGIENVANIDGALKFFGPSNNRLECSTCHNVHDEIISPFLRMSNANSDMCLACHII